MTPTIAIDAVRELFEHGSFVSIESFLHQDVELRPPTYGKAWRGRRLVGQLLRYAASSLKTLRYTDQVSADGLHILRFDAHIAEYTLSGVDVVRLDALGMIVQFEIFARPPKAVLALRDAMALHVRSNSEIAGLMGMALS
jgi:hypothetical protein